MQDKKWDVIVVGELNVDLIMNGIQALPEAGKEILARQMTLTLGSSSAIFACNLSSLGSRVAFAGKIGKDVFGDLVMQSLEEKGVDGSMVIRDERLVTGATVALSYGEDRAMITHPGAMEHFTLAEIQPDQLKMARHLHFSNCFIQPALKKDLAGLFRLAKKAGLSTSLDPQWDPAENWDLDMKNILPLVDIFLPNEAEILQLTGKPDIDSALEALRPFAHAVVVKRGRQGSTVCRQGEKISTTAFLNNDIIDAIGAGDSFNAGFIHQYLQQKPLESCQRFANLAGAISTTAAGGTGAFSNHRNFMQQAKTRFGYDETD